MRKELTTLIERARYRLGAGQVSTLAAEFVIASAIAVALEMPGTAVNDPRTYYVEHYVDKVLGVADAVSKYSLMSVKRVCDLTQTLWLQRYRQVHSPDQFYALFGIPLDELGMPELAKKVEEGEFKSFLLKEGVFIREATEAVLMATLVNPVLESA